MDTTQLLCRAMIFQFFPNGCNNACHSEKDWCSSELKGAKQVFVSQCVIHILCHRGTFDRLRHHTKQGQNALPFPKPHPKAAGATSGTNFLCLGSLLWIMEIPWMMWWNQSHPSSGTLEAFKRGRLHSMHPIRKSKAFFFGSKGKKV